MYISEDWEFMNDCFWDGWNIFWKGVPVVLLPSPKSITSLPIKPTVSFYHLHT